ncbi:MAG: hypothetical protein JWM10_2742 [Myxococcaceae bacterium]|nr:hypothetical protein [Myxococcaceae bacterium]
MSAPLRPTCLVGVALSRGQRRVYRVGLDVAPVRADVEVHGRLVGWCDAGGRWTAQTGLTPLELEAAPLACEHAPLALPELPPRAEPLGLAVVVAWRSEFHLAASIDQVKLRIPRPRWARLDATTKLALERPSPAHRALGWGEWGDGAWSAVVGRGGDLHRAADDVALRHGLALEPVPVAWGPE